MNTKTSANQVTEFEWDLAIAMHALWSIADETPDAATYLAKDALDLIGDEPIPATPVGPTPLEWDLADALNVLYDVGKIHFTDPYTDMPKMAYMAGTAMGEFLRQRNWQV